MSTNVYKKALERLVAALTEEENDKLGRLELLLSALSTAEIVLNGEAKTTVEEMTDQMIVVSSQLLLDLLHNTQKPFLAVTARVQDAEADGSQQAVVLASMDTEVISVLKHTFGIEPDPEPEAWNVN
jgi:hypothetical protein